MADIYQQLPLLLLTSLLLLLLVFLRAFVVTWPPRRRQRRQVDRKMTMDRRDNSVGQQRRVMDFSIPDRPRSGHRPATYDPSLYSHLPPHEEPLPPDPEDAWVEDLSHTLPLGSGSTHEWTSRKCRQREAGTTRESFTALLEEGVDNAATKRVDLDFRLCSGSGASGPIHGGRVVGSPTLGGGSSHVGGPTNGCRPPVPSSMGAGPFGESSRSVTPIRPSVSSPAMRQRATASAAINDGTPPEDIGRHAWENCRLQMRRAGTENITTGVSRIRVGSDVDADDSRRASGDESSDSRCEDDAEDGEVLEIRPMAARGGRRGGRRRQQRGESRGGRGSKALVGDKGGKHPAWSVEEMQKLARAKRDQQAHFEGMPHNYGRMRNREWKLLDLQKWLAEVGVNRTTNDIGKKFDNVFQQYKNLQRYQNMSGGNNFFTLTLATRADEGFNFRMDERVFNEIDNMSKKNKTIYPDNVADTSARGGVPPTMDGHRQAVVGGESSAGGEGGDGVDEDVGSARETGFSAGSTGTPAKRKNMRQQTFDAIAEVMDKHGALMADMVESVSKRQSNGASLPAEGETSTRWFRQSRCRANRKGPHPKVEEAPRRRRVGRRDGGDGGEEETPMDITCAGTPVLGFGRDGVSRQRMLALTNLGVLTSTRGGSGGTTRAQGVSSGDIPPQRVVGSAYTIASVSERGEKAPVGESPSRHVEASNPTIIAASPRAVLQFAQAASAAIHAAALGVGERREDRRVEEARRKHERREETPCGEEEDDQPLSARKKRSRQEEELEAKSKLWVDGNAFWATGPGRMIVDKVHSYADYFCAIVNGNAGACTPKGLMMPPPEVPRERIEDGAQREPALRRARRTENVAMRVIHGWIFRSSSRSDGFARAESYWWDGGRLSHQRVSRIGDVFHLLLAACMWIMRMGGDDARSYDEASYYAQLVAKPTLVVACSLSFNWRRHVMHSTNAVLSRLRKPPLTLGAFPDYIPDWASCGVRYNCNAGLADPYVTARVDWMGTGPFEGDQKEDGTNDETGA
ncbi:hypothetical protein CBR_g37191 [Chara braunii]|uniref:Myb-like domain-containing protein n=1 Tax=Chara braunii TaxID=69332 RepID=A0A388LMC4_CHABU|nr:hypothetical protein CBR_g37191 [Chara braunii]|eukprot:GBG83479.1 hypothetical protein CBR_g37191 [Chara braunii]